MPTNAAEWDDKHRRNADGPANEPSTILRELLPLLPLGPALDLACGSGRNTLFLARRQPVTAVDRSSVGLEILEKRARNLELKVSRDHRIEAAKNGMLVVSVDLEDCELPVETFSLIVCIHYLERGLFRKIAAALVPGGMVLFETYTKAQLEFFSGPRNPDYLLDDGELRIAFPELETTFYREIRAGQGIASLLARKRTAASR
jgi:tellurite methyltransferase